MIVMHSIFNTDFVGMHFIYTHGYQVQNFLENANFIKNKR